MEERTESPGGVARIPLRIRRRRFRAVDEALYTQFPGLFRRATRRIFRLPTQSRFRQAVLRRTVQLSYEAQNRGDWRFAVLPYGTGSELRNAPIAGGGEKVAVVQDLYRGREGAIQLLDDWTDPWESIRFEPEELIDAGDGRLLILSEMVTRGRESGLEVREPLAQLVRFSDGEAIRQENWLGSWAEGLRAIDLPDETGD